MKNFIQWSGLSLLCVFVSSCNVSLDLDKIDLEAIEQVSIQNCTTSAQVFGSCKDGVAYAKKGIQSIFHSIQAAYPKQSNGVYRVPKDDVCMLLALDDGVISNKCLISSNPVSYDSDCLAGKDYFHQKIFEKFGFDCSAK